MEDLRQQLIAAFRDEAREYVAGVRGVLERLKRDAGAVSAAELEEAFRQAHCLKAAARVCDFGSVATIGQRLETVLGKARRREPLTPQVLDAVAPALDAVEAWTRALADDPSAPEPSAASAALDQALGTPTPLAAAIDTLTPALLAAFEVEYQEHLAEMRTVLAPVSAGGTLAAAQVDEVFRRAHSLKGAARIAGLRPAELLAHRLETLFAGVREGQLPLTVEVARVIGEALDAIEDVAVTLLAGGTPPEPLEALAAMDRVLGGRDDAEALPHATVPPAGLPTAAAPAAETVRVSAEQLDRLLRSAGQLLTETQRQDLLTRELAGFGRQLDELTQAWRTVRGGAASALQRLATAPEFAAVARYLELAEQRVQTLAKQASTLRRVQQRQAWDLQQQVGRLHEDARRVRMVSAESILQGFRKMLRDLARDEGKRLDFHIVGAEVQADRLVLQALKDPLMHALSNAVTHGIEPPDERARKGKDATGQVRLSIATGAQRLRITIEDDGRGIDAARVARSAVRLGLLSEAQARALPPDEQARLIFRPGLSTLPEVTDVSGRGMGLSVVHEAVARLHGTVELEPSARGGTRLIITVPLSVATQRLLLVGCRGQTFAVPVHALERLRRVKPAELERVEGRPMVLHEGRPVPVRALAELLAIPGDEPDEVPASLLLVLRSGSGRLAVTVDRFVAEREGLVKRLHGAAGQLKQFAGGILLEDGAVALVLNPSELLRAPLPAAVPAAPRPTPAAPRRQAPTVLVVDDSLTTRTLEKSILEAHGYTVRIATDGVEALAQLRAEPADLVITDVQMPRMDGFMLLAEMKKDARLARLPVIVVTSLGKREDQERGLALGADAYIVKRKFDHEELLETIRQIL